MRVWCRDRDSRQGCAPREKGLSFEDFRIVSDIVVASLGRMPVILLTGYLGSGKTTLLNRLLATPRFSRATVVINEFGDAPLDPLFVEKTDGDLTVMQNRCLCCEVQEDVEGVIGRLFGRRTSRLHAFDRMVIETSGIADPEPIMQVLLNEPRVAGNFRIERVVTVVDAVNGLRQIEEHDEAFKQVMLADRLIVAKSDLCDAGQLADLDRRLEALNPGALRLRARHGDVPPEWLLDGTDAQERSLRRRFERLREQEAGERPPPEGPRHIEGISACSLVCAAPLEGPALIGWLNDLRLQHGERLLRMKGIAELKGDKLPVALHGVHHVLHRPHALPHLAGWQGTSLVLILRETDTAAVGASWDAFVKTQQAAA